MRAWLAGLAAAVALLVMPTASAVAAPTPGPSEFYGANVQTLLRLGLAPASAWPTYLGEMAESGLTIARFDAPWAWAQPKNGSQPYDWSQFDRVATALATQGIRWLPALDLAPTWAAGSGTKMAPEHYPKFAAFAGAFAARFGQGGTFWAQHPDLPQVPVDTYAVWTEANSANYWASKRQDPADYLRVFKLVRDAVKAVDPDAPVLVSLGWQNFAGYLNGLYAAGAKGVTDGIAFDPYAPTPQGVIALTKQLRDQLAANGEPDLPIELTEVGWPKPMDGVGAQSVFDGAVNDRARAAMLTLTGDAMAAGDCGVKSFLVFSLAEPERKTTNNEDWFGILTPDGASTVVSNAVSAMTARWARPGRRPGGAALRLPLCHGADPLRVASTLPMVSPVLLPLRLSVPNTPPACFDASVDYRGNPLPQATVFLRDYRGRQTSATTEADGDGQLCMDPQSRANAFLAWSRVGSMAASSVYYCAKASCRPVACTKAQLRVATTRPRRGRLRVSIAVRCGGRAMFAEPIHVDAVDRNGKRRPLRAFFTHARTDRFNVQIDPARERKLRVSFAGDPTFALRGIVKLVPLRRERAGRGAARARRAAG